MRILVKIFPVLLLGLLATQAYATILSNGNLDRTQAVEIVPGFFLPKPADWVNEGSRSISGPYEDEMSSEPWAGPAPTPVTADGSGLSSPDGCFGLDCAVFFKPFSGGPVTGAATGHLYQDNAAAPGITYLLEAWAGAEANAMTLRFVLAIDFLDSTSTVIESNEVNIFPAMLVDNGLSFDYKKFSVIADAPVNTAFVRARASMIGAMANPAGGGQAIVVDDFSLTAVPEPSTGLLAGAAIAAAAWVRRRKR